MARRKHLSPKARADLWHREAMNAYLGERGYQPICNLCDRPVLKCDAWDESHGPVAHAFGGKRVGVAHRDCNRAHGAKVVTPALAKSNRVHQFHIGARGPGLGRHPMRAGRRSGQSKSFRHGVLPRLTLAERHAATMAKRALFTTLPDAPEA